MGLILNSNIGGGYQIKRSVRLRASVPALFSRTFGTPTAQNTWTLSTWVKKSGLAAYQNILALNGATNCQFLFDNTDCLQLFIASTSMFVTTAVFRDPSAWMHVVLAVNSAAAGSNKVRIYVNGVETTAFSTDVRSTFAGSDFNKVSVSHNIGVYTTVSNPFDGYMAEMYFVDGQQLDPTAFGAPDPTTGVWSPKKYAGTFGANGFYLDFSDNSAATAAAIGADRSGNGNNWTPSGISVTAGMTNDSFVDTPTNYGTDTGLGGEARGNYATLNRLDADNVTIRNANLEIASAVTAVWNGLRGTIPVASSGNWYFEAEVVASGANDIMIGVSSPALPRSSYPGGNLSDTNAVGYQSNGGRFVSGTSTASWGATYAAGDKIGVNINNGSLFYYKNNVLQGGGAAATLSGDVVPHVALFGNSADTLDINFGQRPFNYQAPTGAKAICTQNIPASIAKPSQYFDVVTRTGTGAAGSVTSLAFQPDMLWSKTRSTAVDHNLFDGTRGFANVLTPDLANAEDTTNTFGVTVASNGYSFNGTAGINGAGRTFVEWAWKEGVTQGLDVVTWTTSASAINHGLGVKPSMIIAKDRGTASTNWLVSHKSLGANMQDNLLLLNSTNANSVAAGQWGGEPTSTTFFLGSTLEPAGRSMVAYLFAEVPGFSKFGSYIGNGAADGPFAYCGFRPRWVMVKNKTTAGTSSHWCIHDTARDPFNTSASLLVASAASAEVADTTSAGYAIDFTANGFKTRSTNANFNTSGDTYIFAAFAEAPLRYARAR